MAAKEKTRKRFLSSWPLVMDGIPVRGRSPKAMGHQEYRKANEFSLLVHGNTKSELRAYQGSQPLQHTLKSWNLDHDSLSRSEPCPHTLRTNFRSILSSSYTRDNWFTPITLQADLPPANVSPPAKLHSSRGDTLEILRDDPPIYSRRRELSDHS